MSSLYSFSFPDMLNSANSILVADKKATVSNLKLLLNSEKMSLYGDPYFGTALKKTLFEQTTSAVVDLFIDEIYTTIVTFMPQLYVRREDINFKIINTQLFVDINAVYIPDNTTDLYSIGLTTFDNL